MDIKIMKKAVAVVLVAVILGFITYSGTFALSKPQERAWGACKVLYCNCAAFVQHPNNDFCVNCGHIKSNHKHNGF